MVICVFGDMYTASRTLHISEQTCAKVFLRIHECIILDGCAARAAETAVKKNSLPRGRGGGRERSLTSHLKKLWANVVLCQRTDDDMTLSIALMSLLWARDDQISTASCARCGGYGGVFALQSFTTVFHAWLNFFWSAPAFLQLADCDSSLSDQHWVSP